MPTWKKAIIHFIITFIIFSLGFAIPYLYTGKTTSNLRERIKQINGEHAKVIEAQRAAENTIKQLTERIRTAEDTTYKLTNGLISITETNKRFADKLGNLAGTIETISGELTGITGTVTESTGILQDSMGILLEISERSGSTNK